MGGWGDSSIYEFWEGMEAKETRGAYSNKYINRFKIVAE